VGSKHTGSEGCLTISSLRPLSLPDGTGEGATFDGLAGDRGSSNDIMACVDRVAGSTITIRNICSVNGAQRKRGDGESARTLNCDVLVSEVRLRANRIARA
jgi:hypothetical protein